MMNYLSNLSSEDVKSIESLEKKTGKTLLAFSNVEISPAKVNDDELQQIQLLEEKLGVSLVAVN